MAPKVNFIPAGYHTATPYLIVQGAAKAIDFYKKAFGAEEMFRMGTPDGKIGHAQIKIGDSQIMLADECPEMGAMAPQPPSRPPVSLYLYVPDVDSLFARAVAAGGKALRPVQDQFYGDRTGMLADPFGHTWGIATHKEDVPPEELERRHTAMCAKK